MHSLCLLGIALPLLALGEKGTFQLPVKHVKQLSNGNSQRGAPDNVPLTNAISSYLVEIEVGTPPQKIQSVIDTGSSDLWFPTPSICAGSVPCPYGSCRKLLALFSIRHFANMLSTVDPSQSSTFDDVDPGAFDITYEDGSGEVGDYFTDTMTIAGVTLPNFTMAVANEANSNGQSNIISIMGVSYPSQETLAITSGLEYANYPFALVDQGITNTVAYSLYLDDLGMCLSIVHPPGFYPLLLISPSRCKYRKSSLFGY